MSGANPTQVSGLPASGLALIAANAIPIFGVLFAGWDTFSIVLLYWVETAVIGLLTILRMLTATGSMADSMLKIAEARGIDTSNPGNAIEQVKAMSKGMGGGAKLFLVPFFCVHFGMFMGVHLVFITVLLGGKGGFLSLGGSPFDSLGAVFAKPSIWLIVSVLSLFASHLFSYFTNYLGKGENARTSAPLEMMRPYGRVVVMHLAIILGAFVSIALGSSLAFLILLVVGKTAIDLKFHLREHRKRMEQPVLGGTTV